MGNLNCASNTNKDNNATTAGRYWKSIGIDIGKISKNSPFYVLI